jgi:YVTN family beta-propeller protein
MAEVTVGSDFAGYRIEAVAGRGGMGVVYRARQRRPDRLVALKVIVPELSQDPGFRTRFDRESEIAASIEHPNVIPVYQADEHEGQLFIAMRYVEATDLRLLIEAGLGAERAARIIAQVGSALDAAHARGLVHRDVKPGNILLSSTSDQDHAYLTDFGLAKEIGATEGPTRTGQWVGTLDYVAPEQIEGRGIDARTDVYSLACVLYHVLTGRKPFERDSEVAKMWAHMNEPPPSALEAAPDIPGELDQVVRRGMAKDTDDRYPSAGDLGRAAVAASQGLTVPRAERSVATGAAAPTVGAGVPPTVAAPTRPRRRVILAVAGVLAVAAVAGILVLALGGDEEPELAGTVVGDPIPVGKGPTAITVGGGSVWVANLKSNDVTRIDAKTARPAGKPIPVGGQPYGVAVGEGSVWIALLEDNQVVRLDPRSGKRTGAPIAVGRGPSDVAVGFGAVWVANYDDDTVTRIDARSGRVEGDSIPVGDGPTDVAAGEGGVWVANVEDDTLSRINPQSNEVLGGAIPVGQSPESVAVGEGSVWVANLKADKVTRVDPKSNQVEGAPIAVGERPDDLAVGEGGVWVVNLDGDTVMRIDPKANRLVGKPVEVGDGPATVDVGDGYVWVGDFRADSVERIQP